MRTIKLPDEQWAVIREAKDLTRAQVSEIRIAKYRATGVARRLAEIEELAKDRVRAERAAEGLPPDATAEGNAQIFSDDPSTWPDFSSYTDAELDPVVTYQNTLLVVGVIGLRLNPPAQLPPELPPLPAWPEPPLTMETAQLLPADVYEILASELAGVPAPVDFSIDGQMNEDGTRNPDSPKANSNESQSSEVTEP